MQQTRTMICARGSHSRAKWTAAIACALMFGGGQVLAAQPAQADPDARSQPPANPAESYRTFYPSGLTNQQDANEIQTTLRNMVPRAKVYYLPSEGALAVLASPAEMQLAEKIIADTDKNKKTYRMTFTLTESGAGKAAETQHFTMMLVAGGRTVLKQGVRVPIVTGASDNNAQSSQVQYVDVGLNIDASLEGFEQGMRLHSKIEQSSVAEEKYGMGAQDPQIHQVYLDERSNLVEGKSVSLGSLDIPGSGQHLEMSVLAEPVL